MTYRGLVRIGAIALISIVPNMLSAQEQALSSAPHDVAGAPPTATGTTQTPTLKQRDPRYQLCKGDILDLEFPFTPEFNRTVTVQPDGYITLQGVGDVHVEGQTLPELTQTLKNTYAGILHDPTISIVLKDFEKPYFIVGGEVGHPGKYDLRGDTTVIQAVEVAGGFNEDARHSDVYLFRRVSNDWVETTKLDVKKMLRSGNLGEDAHLHAGDMVFVPKSTMGKIKRFIPAPNVGAFVPIN
jgi:polysaccharide biosynthesis/export protein